MDTTPAVRPPLLTRSLVLVFVCGLCALTSFYLLLSVVPLYATSAGAGGVGAGLATGALMLTTVGGELVVSSIVARLGYRLVYAVGMLLLGAPALALIASASLTTIVAVCLVRGFGFAIAVVAGSALVAELAPPQRRGEGLGVYGVVVGVPSIVALPLGVWLASHVGYPPVFVAAAVSAFAALAAALGLPGRPAVAPERVGMRAGLRTPALVRPAVAFGAIAMAGGVVVTFLPLALPAASANFVAAALLVQAAGATLSRWWAGGHADRRGPGRLLVPAALAAGAGMLVLALVPRPAAVLAAMVCFGLGFGVAQVASIALMFDRVPRSGYGTVSALWNLAYDGGIGLGAVGFGLVTVHTGYSWAFVLTGGVVLATLLAVWRDRVAIRQRG